MHLADEVLQHFLSNLEVSDNAVFQGANSSDIARRTTQHALGIGTYGGYGLLTIVRTDRNYGRLVQHNSLPAYIDKSVSGTQIY